MTKKIAKYSIAVIIIVFSTTISAQHNIIHIKGQVVNASSGKPIPYAQIANYTSLKIYSTDSTGQFSLLAEVTDSLRILAIGFAPQVFVLNDTLLTTTNPIQIKLAESSIDLKPYTVYNITANQHLQKYMPKDIKMGYVNPVPVELRSSIGGKPNILQPMKYMYYHLGTVEKDKERVRKLMVEEKNLSRMSKELIAELSGFESTTLDQFLIYCHTHIKVNPKDTDSFIRSRILDALVEFKKHENIK